jgi:asparagine synthase (glutamine-hydrolysing)
MCGLAGFSGNFSEASLREAGLLIEHRGPDDSGIYFNDFGIGLAFRRLAIIDLSPLGAQPMASADGTVVIVFNARSTISANFATIWSAAA